MDTGASHLTLPAAWKDRLGDLELSHPVSVDMASQPIAEAVVCGPVRIEVEGSPAIAGEVLFLPMEPEGGVYEPFLGYLPLETCQAAVDMLGNRLVHVRHLDVK